MLNVRNDVLANFGRLQIGLMLAASKYGSCRITTRTVLRNVDSFGKINTLISPIACFQRLLLLDLKNEANYETSKLFNKGAQRKKTT